ncbi:MAG TPA: helix-turn-helix domain-containing protein [Solirubrobacterales bacterium]|nr:helix-turn-helix domain-containing protein [Solirubrobacterales bacterium]
MDSAVLTVLAGSTKPRSGREVARLADRSQDATQKVLDRLVGHGLVSRQDAGRAHMYWLNWDHVAAEPIAELADLRSRLFGRLREAFEHWHPAPVHVSVFGSAARGDGDIDSDIDIFLIRPASVDEENEEWRGTVGWLADAVFDWTGNHAGIIEIGERELNRLRRERPAIVESIRVDAVDILGPPARSILVRA